MKRLVGQRREIAQAFEMPDGGVQINRLNRISAGHVDDVVRLRQLQQIAKILMRTRPAALVHIRTIGRTRHLRKDNVVATEAQIMRRVARMQREL